MDNKIKMNQITVGDVVIKLNFKFENISDALKDDIIKLIDKGFKQKLDRYIKKKMDYQNPEWHLNFFIKRNNKGLYDGNFNFKLGKVVVIYKRENFKNVIDLVNHFFDHVKEEFSHK